MVWCFCLVLFTTVTVWTVKVWTFWNGLAGTGVSRQERFGIVCACVIGFELSRQFTSVGAASWVLKNRGKRHFCCSQNNFVRLSIKSGCANLIYRNSSRCHLQGVVFLKCKFKFILPVSVYVDSLSSIPNSYNKILSGIQGMGF